VRGAPGGGIVPRMSNRQSILIGAATLLLLASVVAAQAPARGATPARGRGAAAQPAARPATGQTATLAQVMQGILFPSSNVIFAAQHDEFAAVKPDADPAMATDPIKSVYGGWTAVENASLAIAEATRLITVPGRKCTNGRPVPLQDADFTKFVGELRTAGLGAYKAAQTKDQDKILDAADKVAVACSHCHSMYREKLPEQGGEASRCTK
jgi:hypothetical protein